jgi:hypothetical protein
MTIFFHVLSPPPAPNTHHLLSDFANSPFDNSHSFLSLKVSIVELQFVHHKTPHNIITIFLQYTQLIYPDIFNNFTDARLSDKPIHRAALPICFANTACVSILLSYIFRANYQVLDFPHNLT